MKQHSRSTRPCVLSIAGSDSGGGAGIQADLKTFSAHGVHGLCAIAALTAQNTRGVHAVHVPPIPFLRAQLDALFDDFDVRAVKIGMLANAEVIQTVAEALQHHGARHIVLDPVMAASSGARLLETEALDALRAHLFPLAELLTPNLPETEWLLGRPVHSVSDMLTAAQALKAQGLHAVLIKGGHLNADRITDLLLVDGEPIRFEHPRLAVEGHGTGCTLSSAIAAGLALGADLERACRDAGHYVFGALQHAFRPGRGKLDRLRHDWRNLSRNTPQTPA